MSTTLLDRRTVLQLMSALTAGLAGCASGGGTAKSPGRETGDPAHDTGTSVDLLVTYEDILRELQTHLRAAADHRVGQAALLARDGDPEAILAFVRDTIVWHPGTDVNPYNGNYVPALNREGGGRKYGARGALRAGGGSALDRALLLQEMLVAAGFADAAIAWFDLAPMVGDDPAGLFVRAWERPEASIPVPDDVWASWSSALGIDLDAIDFEVTEDPDPSGEAEALAAHLLAHFDDENVPDYAAECRWNSLYGAVPVVRFTHTDGTTRIANPALPHATLDAPGTDVSTEVDAPDDPGAMAVSVKLSVRTSRSPDWSDEVVLVEGAYTAEQLMGRQLVVSTSPITDTRGLASVPAVLHHTFQTALLVQALDGGDDIPEPIVGDAISLGGERIHTDDSGALFVGDVQVTEGEDGPRADPTTVTGLRLEVDGSHFPSVFARAWPTNTEGNVVEHLQADQLSLEDEGRPTPFLLQANRAVPRAIILRDTSLSMPGEYLDAAGDALMADLAAAIEAAWPGATITTEATGSELWTNLARAASQGANVVVYLTDGDVADSLTPELEAALLAGPPAILVSVRGGIPESLQQMADLTGGVVVPVDDPDALQAAIVDTLGTLDLPPYQLRWVVPSGEAGERLATLQVGSVDADALYDATGANEPVRLMALDLELTMEGRTVRRTLAGWPSFRAYPADRNARDRLHAEVHLALLGGQMLSFEGDGPSPSMVLDDLLSVRLGALPLLRTADLDLDALLDLVATGFTSLPGPLVAAWQPLQSTYDTDSLTFPGAMRVCMVQMAPKTDDQEWATLDLVDLTRWRTVTHAGDARSNFEANLARTAMLALLEDAIGDVSTLSLLDGQPLQQIPDRPYTDTTPPEVYHRWEALLYGTTGVRIGPEDGTTIAYFHIDRRTGAVVAVMPDGSGGVQQILDILAVLDAVIHLYCAVSGAGPALSVVSAYGITLVRLYAAVATALEGFVTAGLHDAIRCALERFACDALVRINAPPLLKAINRFCGLTLGVSLCSVYTRGRGC